MYALITAWNIISVLKKCNNLQIFGMICLFLMTNHIKMLHAEGIHCVLLNTMQKVDVLKSLMAQQSIPILKQPEFISGSLAGSLPLPQGHFRPVMVNGWVLFRGLIKKYSAFL